MQKKITLILLVLSLFVQVFLVIKPRKIPTQAQNFVDYEAITNIVDTIVNTRISSQIAEDVAKPVSASSEVYANSYSSNYSCSFVCGKPALQFVGSSAIYFVGEFCPYGKLLTITPYRCLLKQGSSFAVLYNSHDNIDVNLIEKDDLKDNNQNDNTFPQALDFFGKK